MLCTFNKILLATTFFLFFMYNKEKGCITMYSLLIVDDEPFVCQQIQSAINWGIMNIKVVGEAHNGLSALELADKLRPDIVIADVRMPLMDGISFATEFIRRYPSAQVIFLSGYSDKDYMQNAIRLDAVDYIFKPFEFSDLLSAIERALVRLKGSKQIKSVQADEDLVADLLFNTASEKLPEILKQHSLPLSFERRFIVILVYLNSGISLSHYNAENILDTMELQNLANRYFHAYEVSISNIFGSAFLMSKYGCNYVILANVPTGNPAWKDQLSELLSLIGELRPAIGVSQIKCGSGFLQEAFQEARTAVHSSFLTGYEHIHFASEISVKLFSSGHDAKRDYFDYLEKQNISEASAALDSYCVYLSGCAPDCIPEIREDLLQIALHLSGKLQNPPFQLISEFIGQASTLEDIRQYIHQMLSLYHAEIESRDSHNRIIYEVEKYILDHLGDPLSVKQIADQVYVSSTYLCFLYKKQTGKTLNQFILKMRMEKAKSLLLDTNQKIGDIATSLGYVNQNYFTKIFVSYYGTTPSRFRNHGGKK